MEKEEEETPLFKKNTNSCRPLRDKNYCYEWRQTGHEAAGGDGGNGGVAVCELVNERRWRLCRCRRALLLFSCSSSFFCSQALRLGPPVPLLLQTRSLEDEIEQCRRWPVSENAARRGEEQVRGLEKKKKMKNEQPMTGEREREGEGANRFQLHPCYTPPAGLSFPFVLHWAEA